MSAILSARDDINRARSLLNAILEIAEKHQERDVRDALCQVADCAVMFLKNADTLLADAHGDAA